MLKYTDTEKKKQTFETDVGTTCSSALGVKLEQTMKGNKIFIKFKAIFVSKEGLCSQMFDCCLGTQEMVKRQ